jgi:hypothetical protein
VSRLNDPNLDVAKIVLMGDQGEGKTGAKAALVCLGYTLLMIDTDRGAKILKSLLTDRRYPYAAYLEKVKIDPNERIFFKQIDVPMSFAQVTSVTATRTRVIENVLSPADSRAWVEATFDLLTEWKEGDLSLGGLFDWGPNMILDFDTLSTLAEMAKYWVQDTNNHLGSLEDEYGRDTSGAQEMISRLARRLTSPKVKCNVIATTHITQIDTRQGAPESPASRLRQNKSTDPRGYPAIVGRALSPLFGKLWNDMFVVKRSGEFRDAERRIYTSAVGNINTKNSVWLEDSYSLSTGLGEIFYALQYRDPPLDFIKAIRGDSPNTTTRSNRVGPASGFGSS